MKSLQYATGPIPLALAGIAATPAHADNHRSRSDDKFKFEMVRSRGVVKAGCLPHASGKVRIKPIGPVEIMDVKFDGLPSDTDFDVFVIQVPNAPFGMSWHQGDIETDASGEAHQRFVGRVNVETFIVAPGSAPAPLVNNNAFPDAASSPASGPVHTYHLGL